MHDGYFLGCECVSVFLICVGKYLKCDPADWPYDFRRRCFRTGALYAPRYCSMLRYYILENIGVFPRLWYPLRSPWSTRPDLDWFMMTSSNGNIFRVTGHLCGEFTGDRHKGQWRVALMFSLICVWINGWVNNHEAGDLRPYHAHYDVTVMCRLKAFYARGPHSRRHINLASPMALL